MHRHGRIFTKTAIKVMRGLAEQGKSAAEIADVIGSTAASVRVRCSHLRIKLKRRGYPVSLRSQARRNGWQRLVVYMRPTDYVALTWKAAHMQKSSDELAAKLLEAIVSSDIYKAVLDDDEWCGAISEPP